MMIILYSRSNRNQKQQKQQSRNKRHGGHWSGPHKRLSHCHTRFRAACPAPAKMSRKPRAVENDLQTTTGATGMYGSWSGIIVPGFFCIELSDDLPGTLISDSLHILVGMSYSRHERRRHRVNRDKDNLVRNNPLKEGTAQAISAR